MAPGVAAFLRKACGILRDDAFAFHVRGHAQELADGDDARAAHACDDDAPSCAVGNLCDVGFWQCAQFVIEFEGVSLACFRFLLQLAFDSDEAGAKALDARKIFVAGALVDRALAAKFCL